MLDTPSFPRRAASLPYRQAAGIVGVSSSKLILMGECRGFHTIWKMPEGGIETGEYPMPAALRELWEKTGLRPAAIRRQSRAPALCDYPENDPRYMPGFRGEEVLWFLADMGVRKLARDAKNGEFTALRWVEPLEVMMLAHNELNGDAVTRQRQKIYRDVLSEFGLLEEKPSVLMKKRSSTVGQGRLLSKPHAV